MVFLTIQKKGEEGGWMSWVSVSFSSILMCDFIIKYCSRPFFRLVPAWLFRFHLILASW